MNAVKCLKCNTIIESKHRHDFVFCPCGNIAVDGGQDYKRRVGHGIIPQTYIEVDSLDELQ